MDKLINHWCKVCGSGYHACNECDRRDFITWRAIACTPEHFQAYTILHEYSSGKMQKEVAKKYLEALVDRTVMENCPDPARRLFAEIFAEDNNGKTSKKQKRNLVVENELHEPVNT